MCSHTVQIEGCADLELNAGAAMLLLEVLKGAVEHCCLPT